MGNLKRILSRVAQVEKAVLVLSMLFMTLLVLFDTLGREFFARGLLGANIYATHLSIWAAMAGFGLATASGRHLRPTVTDGLVPISLQPFSIRAGHVISAAISLLITVAAIRYVSDAFSYEERNMVTGMLLWPIQLILPLGFALNTLRYTMFAFMPELVEQDVELQE